MINNNNNNNQYYDSIKKNNRPICLITQVSVRPLYGSTTTPPPHVQDGARPTRRRQSGGRARVHDIAADGRPFAIRVERRGRTANV